MAQYEAMVRMLDIVEADPVAARRAVEDRLRAAGFTRWRIVNIAAAGAANSSGAALRTGRRRRPPAYAGGGFLVAAVLAWALWFLWLLAG